LRSNFFPILGVLRGISPAEGEAEKPQALKCGETSPFIYYDFFKLLVGFRAIEGYYDFCRYRVWITDFDSRMCRNFESKIEQRVDFGTDLDDD
jgi:hypothetical protein